MPETGSLRVAARCLHLRMTMSATPGGNLVNLCQHIVREGRQCVGPFLDDTETACGLWEPAPGRVYFGEVRERR